ncbi:MAG TPA: type II toxin-antitoxin system VapC family toxin [Nitrospiraceae bacterium]|nr:type II toxin-antitoxin system VapC family toxin [Nitrospiraceae bacterium]
MMLYLDTSALVKLYVDEPKSEAVKDAVGHADAVATSLLAYTETRAAFARSRREGRVSSQVHSRIVGAFEEDWSRYVAVEVTDALVKAAGLLAESRALRGNDALHLASALSLQNRVPVSVSFMAFDRELMTAAKLEGLPSATDL